MPTSDFEGLLKLTANQISLVFVSTPQVRITRAERPNGGRQISNPNKRKKKMDASIVCARAAFIATVAVALAGCAKGPSAAQARDALIKRSQQAGVGMMNPDYKEKIAKTDVGGCDRAEAGGYLCEVSTPDGNRGTLRFVETNGSWIVAD